MHSPISTLHIHHTSTRFAIGCEQFCRLVDKNAVIKCAATSTTNKLGFFEIHRSELSRTILLHFRFLTTKNRVILRFRQVIQQKNSSHSYSESVQTQSSIEFEKISVFEQRQYLGILIFIS